MIFRFRNGNNKTTMLFKGCDPNNQRILLQYFKLYFKEDITLILESIEFLQWMYYMMNNYDAGLSEKEIALKESNNIEFYYSYDEEGKQKLIKRYEKYLASFKIK
jgi:hypothetical protein